MAYNSKLHTVSFSGVRARVHAVNKQSAQAQLEFCVKRYGEKLVLDPDAAHWLREQYSVTEVTND